MNCYQRRVFKGILWVACAQLGSPAWADESPQPVDTSKVFKPQRNSMAPHPNSQASQVLDVNAQPVSAPQKLPPKNTSFKVDGHGGSGGTASGGTSTLRHRFNFD